jgi:hypothetical protein
VLDTADLGVAVAGDDDLISADEGSQKRECLMVSAAGCITGVLGEVITWNATPLSLTSPLRLGTLFVDIFLRLDLRGIPVLDAAAGNRFK